MSTFPVTRSILSAPALSEAVVRDYGLAVPTDCQFLQWGLNDTYLLKSKAPTYVLRIYRRGWRSLSEIQYEVEALLHMQKAGIAVSVPVRRHDGTFVGTIAAPEGIRYMVLFTYAREENRPTIPKTTLRHITMESSRHRSTPQRRPSRVRINVLALI